MLEQQRNLIDTIRADINLTQLKRNMEFIRGTLKPGVKFMAVVKGDAYGHGLVPISRAFEAWGSDCLGVVRLSEAASLREAGIKIPIVMLAPLMPWQAEAAIDLNISPMLDNDIMAAELDKFAASKGKKSNVHIKINTGLNRYGIMPEYAVDFIRTIKERYKNLYIEGIYTHFRDPELNRDFTKLQIESFRDTLSRLSDAGIRPPSAHSAASGGLLMYPEAQFDMVRVGILLYGVEYVSGRKILPQDLKPVISIKSHVLKITEVKAGEPGGYGSKFIADRDSSLAIIGAGYGDGISRGWKEAIVRGRRVPIVNYSMDGIVADITDMRDVVKEYDEVVLTGRQGNESISWEEACYAINAEVDEQLQKITKRVRRNYYYEF